MNSKLSFIDDKRFEKYELEALSKFNDFVENLPESASTKWFCEYLPTEYGSIVDVVSHTFSGSTFAIELKARNGNSTNYPDIFIEPSKYHDLHHIQESKGALPLYINIFKDAVYVYRIADISEYTLYEDVSITSQDNREYISDRYGLFKEDAFIFKKDEQGVYQCTQKGKVSSYVPMADKGLITEKQYWNHD